MSHDLVAWLNEHPVVCPSSRQVGTDRTWRVLMNLAHHANTDGLHLWVSDRTQAKETGLDRRLVREARAALADAGWLVRTDERRGRAVVWQLQVPGFVLDHGQANGQANGQGNGQGNGQASLPRTEQNRTTTSKRANRSGARPRQVTQGQGMSSDLVAACVERDLQLTPTSAPPGKALRQQLARDYSDRLAQVLDTYPDAAQGDLVTYLVGQRRGEPVSAALVERLRGTQPQCDTCKGERVVFEQVPDPRGGTMSSRSDCPACEAPAGRRLAAVG